MGAETEFAHKVDKVLKSTPELWYLNVYGNAVQRAGVPDRIICYKGKFIGLELKKPDGKGRESKRQEIEGFKIKSSGGTYAVISSLDELHDTLSKIR